MPLHSHGDASHDHPDAAPGHTHQRDEAVDHEPQERPAPTVVETGPPLGGLTLRVALTFLGAAGMIVGAFLPWLRNYADGQTVIGTRTDYIVFLSTSRASDASFIESAGLVSIILGLAALLGFAFRRGWLTTLAGVGGVAAFVLVVITLYRTRDRGFDISNAGLGLWIVLAGGVLALIAGFFASRARVARYERY